MAKAVNAKNWSSLIKSWTDGTKRSYPPSHPALGLQSSGYPSYYDPEMAFLNIVKRAGGSSPGGRLCPWYTSKGGTLETNEEQYVQLDSNGYATSLVAADVGNGAPSGQTFDSLTMLLFYNGAALAPGQNTHYRPGTYRLKYVGQGTVEISGDASLVLSNSSPSTYVEGTFTVSTPTTNPGLKLIITAITNGTDYPRDISVVHTDFTADYDAGEIFDPAFLEVFSGISCVRGMQWQRGDNIYAGFYSTTFTVPQGATSATLPSTWAYSSGVYPIWFNGGQSVQATCTYGSANITWTGALANATPAGTCVGLAPHQGWANRCPVSYVSYAQHPYGVPEEIIFALANKLNADAWVNLRIDADDNYVQQLCLLADSTLNAGLRCIVELANEVWNGAYYQSYLAQMFGCAQWPGQANDFQQNRNWYGMRCAVISEIAYSTLGASKVPSRVVPILAAQNGNTGTFTQSMETVYWTGAIDGYTGPAKSHHIAALGCAPYWGAKHSTADATTMLGVASPLDDFFAQMTSNTGTAANGSRVYTTPSNGWLGQTETWTTNSLTVANSYGLPLIGYEGGDNFFADDTVAAGYASLIDNAERDPRMATYYKQFLDWWGANVGKTKTNVLVLYCGPRSLSQYGCFGIVESSLQTFSPLSVAPPKWQAVQNYLAEEV